MLWEDTLPSYTALFFDPYRLVQCTSENQPCSHFSPWFSCPWWCPCYRSTSLEEDTAVSADNSHIWETWSLFSNSCFLPQYLHPPQQSRGCCHGRGFICSLARVLLPCSQLEDAHREKLSGAISLTGENGGLKWSGPEEQRKNTEWARSGYVKPVVITLFQFN